MDELLTSVDSGMRDNMDFKIRWAQQTQHYLKHLATIKSKSEAVLQDGQEMMLKHPAINIYDEYLKNTVSFNPSKYVFPRESKELDIKQ
jgi:hypothetical protein